MKKSVKLAAFILSLCTVINGFSVRAYADTAWEIENILDASECRQGDLVTMSVNLKGVSAASQEIDFLSISGTLEYDTSLFTVETADLFPAETQGMQDCSFDRASGIFKVQYASEVHVKDSGLLLQIRLHTAADASIGKTTLCITDMQWKTKSGTETKIENHVPAKITIAEAEAAFIGDVNQDGEVNLTDAKLVMQYYNGAIDLDTQQVKNADTNSDGKVNLTDAKRIMQYYNGEIESLI